MEYNVARMSFGGGALMKVGMMGMKLLNKNLYKMNYYIAFTGIMECGSVKLTLFKKSKTVPLENISFQEWATKFRFLFIAKFLCWFLNKTDDNFRVYKVVKCKKKSLLYLIGLLGSVWMVL